MTDEDREAVVIRDACPSDLAAVAAIYNDAVLTTTATFDTVPRTDGQQAEWFARHSTRHPLLVAEVEGEIVGWASLAPWSDRPAYAGTAENSVYVRRDRRGCGYGSALLSALLDRARASGLHTLLARVAEGNPASLALHEGAGFRTVGVMREVGCKFGRRLDVTLMQVILDGADAARAPG